MSAVYTVGTISVTNGSDIVTGSGTGWVGVIQTGWQIKLPNGEIYWVRQVNSATQLQLENAYTGTSQSNQAYIAGPTGGIARALANKVQDLIGDFQGVADNAGEGKFADGDLAQPGIRFIADEDTGFRRPSSNTLDVVTGGVQRARFSSSGMNLSGLLSGTAVTQSATDTTSGRLMKVGDFGLGGAANTNLSANINTTVNIPTGSYRKTNPSSAEHPTGATIDFVFVSAGRLNATDSHQIAFIPVSGARTDMFVRRNTSGNLTPWHRLYHESNILGTVSQSSGVPTGAIIERGSNANGEFVRFADGTQICTRRVLFDGISVDVQIGTAVYRSDGFSFSFPASFASGREADYVSADLLGSQNLTIRGNGIGARFRRSSTVISLSGIDWSGLFLLSAEEAVGTSGELTQVVLYAIGRWF